MKVAKAVATDLVDSVTGVRFGVARFEANDQGAYISENCDDPTSAHLSDIKSAIAGADYGAKSNTPLAEALYEITLYFRGMYPYYYSGSKYVSPLQYRCQKNFTIVITDGFPTWDTSFPSADSDPADSADSTYSLPNWDGKAPATTAADKPFFPQYSDGFKPQSGHDQADEGWTLYLDDIAKFAFDIDMKTSGNDTDTPPQPWGSMSDPAPLPGEPDFRKQNMSTYAVGFATANQMLEDAAAYGGGQYFTAKNADQLKAALEDVLLDIQSKASTAASVSLNSTRLDTNLALYQASFESADWSGNLKAIDVDDDTGAVGGVLWEARDLMPAPGSRKIFTTKSDTRVGSLFKWANSNDNSLRETLIYSHV